MSDPRLVGRTPIRRGVKRTQLSAEIVAALERLGERGVLLLAPWHDV